VNAMRIEKYFPGDNSLPGNFSLVSLSPDPIDSAQNIDPFVQDPGLVRIGAFNINKISSDLRILPFEPQCGFGEIFLSPLHTGSSVMPGKVDPVMLETAAQACLHLVTGDAMTAAATVHSLDDVDATTPLTPNNDRPLTKVFGPAAPSVMVYKKVGSGLLDRLLSPQVMASHGFFFTCKQEPNKEGKNE